MNIMDEYNKPEERAADDSASDATADDSESDAAESDAAESDDSASDAAESDDSASDAAGSDATADDSASDAESDTSVSDAAREILRERFDIRNYNVTNAPLEIKNSLESLDYDSAQFLKYHQFLVKEYFLRTNKRGILICHGVGQGKTPLAFSITNYVREHTSMRIIVLLPKSLENNFRGAIHKGLDSGRSPAEVERIIDSHYKFISLNASNMFKKMETADKTSEELEYEKRLGEFMDDVLRASSLEGSLLIIDEAHNFFNSITNGSKNAVQLYDLIMKTPNMRIIFLTATPIINHPFELVPCFNMLAGRIKYYKNKAYSHTTLFSENEDEFENYFIDMTSATPQIKNKDKFENRIYGLHSYYGDLYYDANKARTDFPQELPMIVEHVPMSVHQFANYAAARHQELDEGKSKTGKRARGRFSSSKGGSSTYRVKSRQACNYRIPEYALGPIRGKKAREKFLDKIKKEDLLNVDNFSPKFGAILRNIKKHAGQPGIVYSQFVSGEGLALFARTLDAYGYKNYTSNKMNLMGDFDVNTSVQGTPATGLYYAVLSGDVSPDERQIIIEAFNDPANRDGSRIHLLLISRALAEGTDLKRGRHGHIMEPFWHFALIEQIKGRLIRYKSHEDLPKEEQNVQFYIYLSTYPHKFKKSKIKEPTTDVDLYERAVKNKKLINSFMTALAESSFDCAVHHKTLDPSIKLKIQCKMCAPDNRELYYPLLERDMALPNPCRPIATKKIDVNEINWHGKLYFYQLDHKNNVKIFEYNEKLQRHIPLAVHKPEYADIHHYILHRDNDEIIDDKQSPRDEPPQDEPQDEPPQDEPPQDEPPQDEPQSLDDGELYDADVEENAQNIDYD
jgi:hypothetical protein